ncbi:MAG: DUF4199 domain-containing protein [Muribaculaceae bacterium]
MKENKRSVYRRGADDGLKLGPMLMLTVTLVGATPFVPWLTLPAMATVVAVPVMVYILLRRGAAEDGEDSTFSATWLHGTTMFFFSGLLLALYVFVALRWWHPEYYERVFDMTLEVLQNQPNSQGNQMVEQMQQMKEAGTMPTPFDTAIEMLYFVTVSGAMLSTVLALIVKFTNRFKK